MMMMDFVCARLDMVGLLAMSVPQDTWANVAINVSVDSPRFAPMGHVYAKALCLKILPKNSYGFVGTRRRR